MKHRVLVLAESANPEFVSVPLIGWSFAEAIARRAEVHLVTQIRNREPILRQGWREGIDFTTIDTEWAARRMYSIGALLGARNNKGYTILQALAPVSNYAFEAAVWKRFGGDITAGRYDIVHRLTPVSPTTPGILAPRLKRLGVPLVVGPMNGGLPWPAGFGERMHREREWLSKLRGAYRLLPGYWSTQRDAAAIIAGSCHTMAELTATAAPRSFYMAENGIDPKRFGKRRTRRAGSPLKVAFVGRLVPYKAADVLVRAALPMLRAGRMTIDIVGDGPERPALEALIARLGVGDLVTLHGNVDHHRVQDILVDCDCLACPSIREFGGGVVLEAMALGVAPVVADYGGQTELIDENCGIRVGFSTPESLETGFRDTLAALVANPSIVDGLGDAARVRIADNFTWDRKAEAIVRIYDWARFGGEKPEFALPDSRRGGGVFNAAGGIPVRGAAGTAPQRDTAPGAGVALRA